MECIHYFGGSEVGARTQWWHGTVSEYSDLHLTIESDKLAALSGTAGLYDKHWSKHDRGFGYYLAGLWNEASITISCGLSAIKLRLCHGPKPTWAFLVLDISD
jgi:hypothetical protein